MFRLHIAKKQDNIKLNPKFYPSTYCEPENKDMAIVLVHFNACRSVRIAQNILLVKQCLDNAKIPYYIGELSIDNSPFLFNEGPNIFHYATDNYMFYKENLVNLVEARIPDKYTKICTLDGDIFFDDPTWYSRLSIVLDEVDICQPFHTANWLNIENNTIIKSKTTCIIDANGHPGFAWAFTRACYSLYKFPDFAIMGSGDTNFYNCVIAKIYPTMNYLADMCFEYMNRTVLRPSVKYLDVNIYHLHHGSLVNRKYTQRHSDMKSVLSRYQITYLSEIIDYDANGLRCWKDNFKQPMNEFLRAYLTNRHDDGI
jgi:hypothetical protein